MNRRSALLSDLALVLITVAWGTTFPISKQLLLRLPPLTYSGLRFGIAGVTLALISGRGLLRMNRRDWLAALIIALTLVTGFVFQALGLRLTAPTKSAFLTALSVPLVPFAGIWILKTRPAAAAWAGCGLAFAGTVLLTYQPGLRLEPGDLLTVVTAVSWALEMVLVSRFMPGRDALAMTAAMCLISAALALGAGAAVNEPFPRLAALPWGTMLWLSVVCGAATLLVQNVAQQHTSAVHAAIIFSLEPLWAAWFAYIWMGDHMAPRAWAGAGLILGGILVAELVPERSRTEPVAA